MKFTDEMLMAYADGELDLVARAEIEAAMARDPEVARAVERHRAMSARIHAAYDGVLAEPVPERLAALAAAPGAAPAAELRAKRSEQRLAMGRWQLPAWVALAASVALGVLIGVLVARPPTAVVEEVDGVLVARGALDAALTSELASAPGDAGIRIGITFRDRDGNFCRSFHLQREESSAGLACRSGEDWKLEALASAPGTSGDIRPAAAMPLTVLHAIDARIAGEPLDAAAEAAARDAGWR
jgi:anti-sigma factor RsiW